MLSGVYAYVTLKEEVQKTNEEITEELKALVKKQIGSFAVPECMQVTLYLFIN